MQKILFLFILFFSFKVQAKEFYFSYQYKPRETLFSLELEEIIRHFEDKKFVRLSANSLGNLPHIHADEVLQSVHHSGTIFIKLGLIAPKEHQNKLMTSGNLTLYHTDKVSIAFFDLSSHEVTALLQGLNQKKTFTNSLIELFIPSVHASDQVFCREDVKANAFTDVQLLENKISNSLLVKKIGECGLHALRSAEGQVEEAKNFFSGLVYDPGKLWREMKENFNQLKYIVSDLVSKLQIFYQTAVGLTLEDLLIMGCQMAVEITTNMLLTATGAGAGLAAAKIVSITIPKLQRLQNLLELTHRKKLSKKTAMESLSCAI